MSAWSIVAVHLSTLMLQGADPTTEDLAGIWAGEVTHGGQSTAYALELEPTTEGKVAVKLSVPAIHVLRQAIGERSLIIEGDQVKLGSATVFTYDPTLGTLTGVIPESLAPVYKLPVTLRRVAKLDLPARPEIDAPLAQPIWTFEAGSALWPGATFADGVVYVGAEDGRLLALDARSGKLRWTAHTGGKIRARATVAEGAVYVHADDGRVYRFDPTTGVERWRVRVNETAVVRLPFDDPESRYDRFGSEVTVAGGRLFVGTHDGRVLALDPEKGERIWEFAGAESVLAAPAVDSGRVYFGGYDGRVYALDATTGALAWKQDTGKPVVSTPAVAGQRVVVGSRSYDLLGLDAKSGEIVWKHYLWFSWVESSPTLNDGIVYVGSSDAAIVAAHDSQSGRRLWATDVWGWAWGQPAVSDRRVYIGTCGMGDYLTPHRGGVVALERATGKPVWRFAPEPSEAKTYGFPGAPALGVGLMFVTDLAGRVYAFPE